MVEPSSSSGHKRKAVPGRQRPTKKARTSSSDPAKWKSNDVAEWIETIDLQLPSNEATCEIKRRIVQKNINGAKLKNLEEKELEELGILPISTMVKFEAECNELFDPLMPFFRECDTERSGLLTRRNLGDMMNRMQRRVSGQELDTMMEEADQDGDGRLSFNEFKQILCSKHLMSSQWSMAISPHPMLNKCEKSRRFAHGLRNTVIRARKRASVQGIIGQKNASSASLGLKILGLLPYILIAVSCTHFEAFSGRLRFDFFRMDLFKSTTMEIAYQYLEYLKAASILAGLMFVIDFPFLLFKAQDFGKFVGGTIVVDSDTREPISATRMLRRYIMVSALVWALPVIGWVLVGLPPFLGCRGVHDYAINVLEVLVAE